MNRSSTPAVVLVVAVLAAACSPESQPTTSTTEPTTTTTTRPTTTTVDPSVIATETCEALKVAAFDLDTGVTDALAGLDLSDDASELEEAEIGRVVVDALVTFYDDVDALADHAPEGIAVELRTISAAVDPWRDALDSGTADLEAELADLDPESIRTDEVDAALDTVDAWSAEHCESITLDVEEILFTTVFGAMFGVLGDAFGQLGESLGGTIGDGLTDEGQPVDLFAVAYGDDPEYDDLYERCGVGDGEACSDLSFTAIGEYELWGNTCGATMMLLDTALVDCTGKFGGGDATAYGDDFVLDSLWDRCDGGDADSCDGLFAAAPIGSDYERHGATCGATRTIGEATRPCSFVASGEAYTYGDDPGLDGLWDACSVGDSESCSELFLVTPFDSAYEAFGLTCGDLVDAGRTCENVAAWLSGPVG